MVPDAWLEDGEPDRRRGPRPLPHRAARPAGRPRRLAGAAGGRPCRRLARAVRVVHAARGAAGRARRAC
nr:hypothetical protein [Angustibacter aerolatus]